MEKHVGRIVCYNGESTGVTAPERNCLTKVFLGSSSLTPFADIWGHASLLCKNHREGQSPENPVIMWIYASAQMLPGCSSSGCVVAYSRFRTNRCRVPGSASLHPVFHYPLNSSPPPITRTITFRTRAASLPAESALLECLFVIFLCQLNIFDNSRLSDSFSTFMQFHTSDLAGVRLRASCGLVLAISWGSKLPLY